MAKKKISNGKTAVRRSSSNPSIAEFKRQLLAAANPKQPFGAAKTLNQAYANIKATAPVAQFAPLMEWLRTQPIARRVFPDDFPTDIGRISTGALVVQLDLEAEMYWAVTRLRGVHSTLTQYAEKWAIYQRATYERSHNLAEKALEDIRANCGQSIWLLKRGLATAQHLRGVDAQKQLLHEIKDNAEPKSNVAYICHFASLANEPEISAAAYINLADSNLFRITQVTLRRYLQYHLLGIKDPADYPAILQYASAGTAVDLYEAVLAVLSHAIANNSCSDEIIKFAVTSLRDISDCRTEYLAGIVGFTSNLRSGKRDPGIAATGVLADAWKHVSQGGAPREEADHLLLRTRDYEQARARLEKLALQHKNDVLGSAASVLLERVVNGIMPWATSPEIVRHIISCADGSLGALLNTVGSDVHEKMWNVATAEARTEGKTYLTSPYTGMAHPEWRLWCELIVAGSRGDSSKIYEIANAISAEASGMSSYSERLRIRADIQNGDYRSATRRAVEIALADQHIISALPLAEIADHLVQEQVIAGSDDITIPLLFNLCVRYVDDSFEPWQRDSYQDFLAACGAEKATDLSDGPIGQPFMRDFLWYVCKESVMDTSLAFHSSAEVLEERLGVCRILQKIDPSDAVIYEEEISELARGAIARKRLAQLEQSKIYVDVEGIFRNLESIIEEMFSRYRTLAHQTLTPDEAAGIRSALRKALRGEEVQPLIIAIPGSERLQAYEYLFNRIRDEYVINPEYGLDGYLSVRVRHGTFAGQLRRPVELARLVTERDERGNYRINQSWNAGIREPSVREFVQLRLATFAQEFDKFAGEVVDELLQIRRPGRPKGVFNFDFSEQDIANYELHFTEATSYDEFAGGIFAILEARLDQCLADLRQMLQTQGAARLTNMFTNIIADLGTHADTPAVRGLINAVHGVHTEVLNSLARVVGWFKRAELDANEPVVLAELLDVCERAVCSMSRGVNMEVSGDANVVKLSGALFPDVSDVIVTAFANVARHAEPGSTPIVKVDVQTSTAAVELRLSNALAKSANEEELRSRIAAIKDRMIRANEYVAREGGTGLIKIYRILERIGGELVAIEVGQRSFELTMQLPARVEH